MRYPTLTIWLLAAVIMFTLAGSPDAKTSDVHPDGHFVLIGTSVEMNASGITQEISFPVQIMSISQAYDASETSDQMISIDSMYGSGFDHVVRTLTPTGVTSSFVSWSDPGVRLYPASFYRRTTGDVLKFSASGMDANTVRILVNYRRLDRK